MLTSCTKMLQAGAVFPAQEVYGKGAEQAEQYNQSYRGLSYQAQIRSSRCLHFAGMMWL